MFKVRNIEDTKSVMYMPCVYVHVSKLHGSPRDSTLVYTMDENLYSNALIFPTHSKVYQ